MRGFAVSRQNEKPWTAFTTEPSQSARICAARQTESTNVNRFSTFVETKIVPIRIGLPAHIATTLGPTQRRAGGPAVRHHMAGGHMGRGTCFFRAMATGHARSVRQAGAHRRTGSAHRLRQQHWRAAEARTEATRVGASHASSAASAQQTSSRDTRPATARHRYAPVMWRAPSATSTSAQSRAGSDTSSDTAANRSCIPAATARSCGLRVTSTSLVTPLSCRT